MKVAVLVLNFGEPEKPTHEHVVPFLERIFMLNMPTLEGGLTQEQRLARAHELAVARAPGLIEEYEVIGGSPLNGQARAETAALEAELRARGHGVRAYLGMQFTEPLIDDAVRRAHEDGAELVVGLPIYPLAGPSTNVAALAQMKDAIDAIGWQVDVKEITGWHTHTAYTQIRADAIRNVLIAHDLDLSDPRTKLVFSAHGTPTKYLKQGSRYELYVHDACRAVAEAVGAPDYALGYQNHTNRPVEWTQPDIDKVVESIDADTIVVDACSFMHEQSETLAELDHELKEEAEECGLAFYRVPIPVEDPRFHTLLADLVEPFITGSFEEAGFRPCLCRQTENTWCLNRVVAESETDSPQRR